MAPVGWKNKFRYTETSSIRSGNQLPNQSEQMRYHMPKKEIYRGREKASGYADEKHRFYFPWIPNSTKVLE